MTSTKRPKTPLPNSCSLTVKSAVFHAISLAQFATVYPSVLAMFGVRRVRIGWPTATSHYGGNAETYMNVGEAMGKAMVALIRTSRGSSR